jgi:hypothetical protein
VSPRLVYALIVIGTTIWVGIDASNLDMRRGRLGGGLLDMSVASWVICCALFWIISFPCYFIARGRYRRPHQHGTGGSVIYGLPPQQMYPGPESPMAYSPPPPPQMSPDGRWWWNGQQWVAMSPAMVPGHPGGV